MSVPPSIQSKANVTKLGAILLGKHVACDAYDENRPIRMEDFLLGRRDVEENEGTHSSDGPGVS